VSYRKDQGRYARMVAFWALVLLIAYGCFHGGGFVTVLDGWLGDGNTTFVDPFPLIGSLTTASVIALALLVAAGWLFHRILNKPKVADALIETEAELHKVTWPTWPETWAGTLAVAATVLALFLFLTVVDLLLTKVMGSFWGGG
jgi:preprotein translocase SecE subunit